MNLFSHKVNFIDDANVIRKSQLKNLNPFLDDDGVLRYKIRYQNVEWLDMESEFPNILPNDHPLSDLIVKEAHEKIGHTVGRY